MKILMTGGTGLLGRAFISRFVNCDFTVLTRSTALAQKVLPNSVVLIECLSALKNLDDFDAVINLAGEPIFNKRWSAAQKNIISQSRWHLTQQLVDLFAASSEPPSVFLSASAVGIYGDAGSQSLTESAELQTQGFSTQLCTQWENIARKAEPYTRVVLLRTGIVLSCDGGALQKMLTPFKWGLGGPIGSGQQYMPWIHYEDHIRAMYSLLNDRNIYGAVNVVAPSAVTNREFTHALAAQLSRPALLPMPETLLKLALGKSSCLLLDSQNVVPQKLIRSGFSFSFPALNTAFSNLIGTP